MVNVQVSQNARQCQVEGFPETAKRSCIGSLHLKPGATKQITEDELKHLEENHAGLVRVLSRPVSAAKAVKAKAATAEVASVPPPVPEPAAAAVAPEPAVDSADKAKPSTTKPKSK